MQYKMFNTQQPKYVISMHLKQNYALHISIILASCTSHRNLYCLPALLSLNEPFIRYYINTLGIC